MSFFVTLKERAQQIDSLLCINLDPQSANLENPTAQAALEYCQEIVAATSDLALAFKPNSAYFIQLGGKGIDALHTLTTSIPDNIPVILDGKRGDVGSAAVAYARAAFETIGGQAVTWNPYFGYDAILPFIENSDHGIFMIVKTANPGAADLQEMPLISGKPVYEHLAAISRTWNQDKNIGLMVSAADLSALRSVRKASPSAWLLTPDIATSGRKLETALQSGLRPDGFGMLVPIACGTLSPEEFRETAKAIKEEVNQARHTKIAAPPEVDYYQYTQLAQDLFTHGCVQFGDFTIEDGIQSPIFIDLRILTSIPRLLTHVASAYVPFLESLTFDLIAAIPYSGFPIGTAISIQGNWPLIYPRKEILPGDDKVRVEGVFHPGDRAVLIDDLTTTGNTKFESIKTLTKEQITVQDIVVLIDRESGGNQKLVNAGYRLHAIFTLTKLSEMLLGEGLITTEQVQAVLNFIEQTAKP